MLNQYLFVTSNRDGSFPERLRIISDEQDTNIPDADELTGSVKKVDVATLKAQLSQSYPAPEFRVATAWANTWKAVQHNYRGLDYEYD